MRTYTTSKPADHRQRVADGKTKLDTVGNGPGRYGFTLVEVLLVVVIIALMAAVSGGIYLGTYRNMLARKSARDFLLAAKYARVTAIEQRRPCKIELDAANNGFWLVSEQVNEETGQTKQVMVRNAYSRPMRFGGGVKFEDVRIKSADLDERFEADNQRTIVFSPDGTAQSAVIQIGDGENHYTVSISAATGRVKMYSGPAEKVKTDTIDLDEVVMVY
jgi:type II secretion system protein H